MKHSSVPYQPALWADKLAQSPNQRKGRGAACVKACGSNGYPNDDDQALSKLQNNGRTCALPFSYEKGRQYSSICVKAYWVLMSNRYWAVFKKGLQSLSCRAVLCRSMLPADMVLRSGKTCGRYLCLSLISHGTCRMRMQSKTRCSGTKGNGTKGNYEARCQDHPKSHSGRSLGMAELARPKNDNPA